MRLAGHQKRERTTKARCFEHGCNGRSFYNMQTLKRHQQSKRLKKKVYFCYCYEDSCSGRQFANPSKLNLHQQASHQKSSTLGSRSLSGVEDALRVFDELNKGLEWSQGQCERAAHQFLRDGVCSVEIEIIKRKLAEVIEKAKKEVERLEGEEKRKNSAALGAESNGEKSKVLEGRLRRVEMLKPE